jgi:hypothetical protein
MLEDALKMALLLATLQLNQVPSTVLRMYLLRLDKLMMEKMKIRRK